jgi:DNA-binding transcriptional MocR family regulator
MRRLYAARRAALIEALATDLPGVARREPAGSAAGLHLLVGFAVDWCERELVARAAANGVGLDPAGACYLGHPPTGPTALIGYAALAEDRIRAGIRTLAATIRC